MNNEEHITIMQKYVLNYIDVNFSEEKKYEALCKIIGALYISELTIRTLKEKKDE